MWLILGMSCGKKKVFKFKTIFCYSELNKGTQKKHKTKKNTLNSGRLQPEQERSEI